MYKNSHDGQMSIYDFILPCGGQLDKNNRWVKLRNRINWSMINDEYEKNFGNKTTGNVTFPVDVAFGSLYIQRRFGFTDRELVEQISENPYFQYFLGFKEFIREKPYDPSLLVTFRKRLNGEVMDRIIEKMFIDEARDDDESNNDGSGSAGGDGNSNNAEGKGTAKDESTDSESQKKSSCEDTADGSKKGAGNHNHGTLIIDASCLPADIAFPTDLELCDKARRWTEIIIDHYWKLVCLEENSTEGKENKPRTYREVARRRFLKLNKRRKKTAKKIRKEIRYQLGCIKRNISYITDFAARFGYDVLLKVERLRLETITAFYDQQISMLENKTHSVADRIVSLSQPWVRPIVRGKSKAPTEFGAKISISVVNGYVFIDKISFDAYNEGEHEEFKMAIEKYKGRFGYYPERVLADKIYRSKNNRAYCKEKGIRMSGPKLGRPGKDNADEIRQELKEIGERNAVEGKFGNGKRKLSLDLIMGKLKETSGSMAGMDFFIMNMERLLRQEALFLYNFFKNTVFESLIRFFERTYVYIFGVSRVKLVLFSKP